jgi:hypothetical protein
LIFIELKKMTEKQSLSRVEKLDLFILNLEPGKWISTFKSIDGKRTTEPDTELIEVVKSWIDGDFLGPKYYLVFDLNYTKFKKGTNENN